MIREAGCAYWCVLMIDVSFNPFESINSLSTGVTLSDETVSARLTMVGSSYSGSLAGSMTTASEVLSSFTT